MIIKWTTSPYNTKPSRQEYCKETEHFYMHAHRRGRDAKISSYTKYFDSEAEALEYIRQRQANKDEQRRVDQIKSAGVELLEALDKMLDHFEGNVPLWLFELAEGAVAKARGDQ